MGNLSPSHKNHRGRLSFYTDKLVLLSIVLFILVTAVCCWVIGNQDFIMPPLPTTPRHEFADWTMKYILISIGFFMCTIATTLYRFAYVEQSREQMYLILAHLSMNVQGCYSYFCVYHWRVAYIDPWGLAVAPAVFAMWCFNGGGLAYLMMVDRMDTPLSSHDNAIVGYLYLSIISGVIAVRTHYFEVLMLTSWICLLFAMWGIVDSIGDRDCSTLLGRTKTANTKLYFCIGTLFGVITLLVNFGYINNDQLLVALAIMDAFTKGIMTILNLDFQLVRLLSLESQLTIELEANTRRREFMKYMFHEVRNPLNTIAMGLDYFSALDQSGWAKNFVFTSVLHSITHLEATLDSFLLIQQMEENTFELSLSSTKIASVINEVIESFPQQPNRKPEIHLEYLQTILASSNGLKYMVDIANIQFVINRMLSNAGSLADDPNEPILVTVSSIDSSSFSRQDILNGKKSIRISVKSVAGSDIDDVLGSFFSTYTSLPTADKSGNRYNSMMNYICNRIAEHHGGYMSCELGDNRLYVVQTLVFCCDPADHGSKSARKPKTPFSRHTGLDSARSSGGVSEYSPRSDAKRFVVNSSTDSPVLHKPADQPFHSPSETSLGASMLSAADMQSLGTAKSVYRTKVDLAALCRHNQVTIKSNFSKSDIITLLQQKEMVAHLPRGPTHSVGSNSISQKESVTNTNKSTESASVPVSDSIDSREKSSLAERDESNFRFDSLRTLVVDDSAMNRKMLQRMLKLFNVQSDVAEDGQQAVDAVLKFGPGYYDIIFMDYTMPVMDGVEATRIIRNELKSLSKIVAVTGNAMEADVKAFGEAGANRVILKPIRHPVLKEELLSVLSQT